MDSMLDAHAKPPAEIRAIYKSFHKAPASSLHSRQDLVQFQDSTRNDGCNTKLKRCLDLPIEIREAFGRFLVPVGASRCKSAAGRPSMPEHLRPELDEAIGSDQGVQGSTQAVYEVPDVPGLYIYPSLLPPEVQIGMLERLLHRDLCNPRHQTNVHMHYHVPYPSVPDDDTACSFFDQPASGTIFQPLDPAIHKPISNEQFLNKKLRWTTLGGQYDWTNKVYPSGPPPAFPSDVKQLIEDIFPMKAEAAIVNVYSPGDTLSLHRDVSEECNRPLASVSLGCDALFIAGLEGEGDDGKPRVATIRVRSGDAVLMSGESRYAWHGVPKVLEGTCPPWMEDWPSRSSESGSERFEHWKGWMKGKRVNLNVRQMFG